MTDEPIADDESTGTAAPDGATGDHTDTVSSTVEPASTPAAPEGGAV